MAPTSDLGGGFPKTKIFLDPRDPWQGVPHDPPEISRRQVSSNITEASLTGTIDNTDAFTDTQATVAVLRPPSMLG